MVDITDKSGGVNKGKGSLGIPNKVSHVNVSFFFYLVGWNYKTNLKK